jgi:thioesterase domain-containing protein
VTAWGLSYLVTLSTSVTGSPLFCVPGSGGDVTIFRDLAALMGDRPIYAIDLSKVYDACGDLTIERLAGFCLKEIRENQEHGPYYLCGYSFGGLVAYEIASLLSAEGERAGFVALVDTPNPALYENLSSAEAARFRATYLTDRIKKYGRNLIHGNLRALGTDFLALLSSAMGESGWRAARALFKMINRPMPEILRGTDPAYFKAGRAYVPKPCATRLIVFRGSDRGPEYDLDRTMGWGLCAAGGIDIHVVPGGHLDILNVPHVSSLVDKLGTYF